VAQPTGAAGANDAGPGALARPAPERRFLLALAVVTLVGIAIRVVYILQWRRDPTASAVTRPNDSSYYFHASRLLAEGKGFVNPFFSAPGHWYQSADHPPLYQLFLASWHRAGLGTPTELLLVTGVCLGGPAVWLAGLAGRAIRGARVGLLGAAAVAVSPNVWSWDGMLLSESMAILTVTLTIWAVYRAWRAPSTWNAALAGGAAALAALSRAELVLLLPFVVLVVLWRRGDDRAPRRRRLVAAGAAAAVLLGPWVGYNMVRFEHPVYLSIGFDITLSSATCDDTYYGRWTGYWSVHCAEAVRDEIRAEHPPTYVLVDGEPRELPVLDQSEEGRYFREDALDYIRAHLGRHAIVVLARLGRATYLWRPLDVARLDANPEGRDLGVAYGGMWTFWALAPLAAVGALGLRRARVPLSPLMVPLATVAAVVAVTFGTSRYRASAEPAICLLAAAGVDVLLRAWSARRAREPAPA
jgi:4-amino-4-deoxy-L-arabinose transferase-like glycosyltransferase